VLWSSSRIRSILSYQMHNNLGLMFPKEQTIHGGKYGMLWSKTTLNNYINAESLGPHIFNLLGLTILESIGILTIFLPLPQEEWT